MIKFDKEGNKIQEKKIEEKPLSFPKAPELNKHILAAAANSSPTSKSPVSPSSTAKSPSSPTNTKESENTPSAETTTPKNAVSPTPAAEAASSGGSTRVIPIKIVGNSAGNNNGGQKAAKVKKSTEITSKTRMPSGDGSLTRNIPINVEGRGLIDSPSKSSTQTPAPSGHSVAAGGNNTPVTPETAEEAAEGMDSLGRPISRRRWGSRKKRFSSAYSDSSMSDGGEVSFC